MSCTTCWTKTSKTIKETSMQYAVDSQRQAMKATGIVNPAMAWEDGPNGRRPSKTVQDRDENTGMPLWEVEVSYRQTAWGRESTTTAMVKVGAPERPAPQDDSRITFKVLSVEVRTNKGGGVGEHWSAEYIDQMTALKAAAPKSAA
jgi:hypothetical protein